MAIAPTLSVLFLLAGIPAVLALGILRARALPVSRGAVPSRYPLRRGRTAVSGPAFGPPGRPEYASFPSPRPGVEGPWGPFLKGNGLRHPSV